MELLAAKLALVNLAYSTDMCRFLYSCEWWGKESQQFQRGLAFISQSMFKTDWYGNYLSIFDKDLRLI
jgi:hypothetical protein